MKTLTGYLNEEDLFESAFKEGSVLEGIFAIAVALYIKDGKMPSFAVVDAWRQKIIPSKMTTKAWTYRWVPAKAKNLQKRLAPDTWTLNLIVRLKPGEMIKGNVSAFGPDDHKLYVSKVADIPKLETKVETMLRDLKNTSALRKIDAFINDIKDNNTKDDVEFFVNADGVTGESSGGIVKGDVFFQIKAKIGGKGKKGGEKVLDVRDLGFSLKSDSHTFGNLGPWTALNNLANIFDVSFSESEIPERIKKVLTTDVKNSSLSLLKEKRLSAGLLFDLLIDKLASKYKSEPAVGMRQKVLNILKIGAFGSDKVDVIEFKEGEIKEILPGTVDMLLNSPAYDDYVYSFSYRYVVDKSGKKIVGKPEGGVGKLNVNVTFVDYDGKVKTQKFWQARAKLLLNRSSSTGKDQIELKVMFEGGDFLGKYGGATEPPVGKYYDQDTKKPSVPAKVASMFSRGSELPGFLKPIAARPKSVTPTRVAMAKKKKKKKK